MAQPVPSDLVEAARRGSALEIERLLQAVWPVAYRLAYSVLGDRETAQDAAQESCVILYRTIASLRDPAAFRAWFYRIVVREASSLKRRHLESNIGQEAAQQVEDRTTALDVWRALSTLPQHLRDVVVLRYFEDLPSREIASILRIHDGAVRFRLDASRTTIRYSSRAATGTLTRAWSSIGMVTCSRARAGKPPRRWTVFSATSTLVVKWSSKNLCRLQTHRRRFQKS